MWARLSVLWLVGIAVASVPLMAENDWRQEIHCSSASGGHGGGDEPQQEPTVGGEQCHGAPGDIGDCPTASGFGNSLVICTSSQLPNQSNFFCHANLTCPDGSMFNCGGKGVSAFGGVMGIGTSEAFAFIHCEGGSQAEVSYRCGLST